MSILQKNCLMSMFGTCPHNNIILNVTVYLEHFHFSFLKFFFFLSSDFDLYNFFLTLITCCGLLCSHLIILCLLDPLHQRKANRDETIYCF